MFKEGDKVELVVIGILDGWSMDWPAEAGLHIGDTATILISVISGDGNEDVILKGYPFFMDSRYFKLVEEVA